jgi:hypothetical protein
MAPVRDDHWEHERLIFERFVEVAGLKIAPGEIGTTAFSEAGSCRLAPT